MVIALLPYNAQGGLSALPAPKLILRASAGLTDWLCFGPRAGTIFTEQRGGGGLPDLPDQHCLALDNQAARISGTGEPTQSIIKAAAQAQTPLRLSCFPYPLTVAQGAAIYGGGRVVLDGNAQKIVQPHCLSFSYLDVEAFGISPCERNIEHLAKL